MFNSITIQSTPMQQNFNEMLGLIKQLNIEQIQEIYWVTREILFEEQKKERSLKKGKKSFTNVEERINI